MPVHPRGTVVEAVELHRLAVPLRRPFRASHGVVSTRDVLLVRVRTDVGDGWGECPAEAEPTYTAEFTEGAALVLRHHLVPRLLAAGRVDARDGGVARLLGVVRGHPMARFALDTAVLDAQLRASGTSLAAHLGVARPHVEAGAAVGMVDDPGALVEQVASLVEQGYRRVKLKVAPGHDVVPTARVRAAFPDLTLAVDANGAYGAYGPEVVAALAPLDELGLQFLEQPLDPDDLLGSVRLAEALATPVCLDEAITSAGTARAAASLGAMAAVAVKAARLGGLGAAVALHDAARADGIDLACGGLLETGVGRAVNLAVAALDGFTLTGDVSAGAHSFRHDVTTTPIDLLPGGLLAVPDGPGIGVDVDPDALRHPAQRAEVLVRA